MPPKTSRLPEDQNKKKKLQAYSQVKMLWRLLFYAGIAALSCACGALALSLLKATPLKNGQDFTHLPHRLNSINSVLPSTLDRPTNLLILGIDNSGHPHSSNFTRLQALAGNSDTMLLVRLIPETHQINILSIPRDTRVLLPGYGMDKINDANVRGGVNLAAQTVSHLLAGIPIDHYIRLDTEGFIQLVDALGGVEVTVPKRMVYVDHTQNLKINLAAGRQNLNGQHLQEYVRFRDDALGDIGRVQRQQEVLKALLQTFWQPSTVGHLSQLLRVVQDNVDTDMSVGQMLGLTQFLAHLDRQHMNLLMLPGRFSRKNEYKLSYWIEYPRAAAPILARYFDARTDSVNAITSSTSNVGQIRLAVANATGRAGEAAKTVAFLRKQGFYNTYITHHEIDSATVPLFQTQIIAQQGNNEAANAVRSALGLGQVQVASTGDIGSDVTVVVGTDLAALAK